MPIYTITDEATGATFDLEGDTAPTQAEINQVIATMGAQAGEGSPLWDAAKRGAGLAVRSVLEGGASIPLAMADIAAYPINLISRALTDEDAIANYQGTFSQGLSELGLPSPETGGEQLASAVGRGASSIAGGIGAGQLLSGAQGTTARGVGDILRAAPEVQAAAGGAAGGGSDLARQAGFGQEAQAAIGLASGLAGGMAASRGAVMPQSQEIPAGARTTAPTVTPEQVAVIAEAGAQKLGLKFGNLSGDLQDAIKRNAEEALNVGSDLTPDAVARKAVYESLGITPTRALITRNFDDALKEQNLLTAPEGDALRAVYVENNRAVRDQLRQLAPVKEPTGRDVASAQRVGETAEQEMIGGRPALVEAVDKPSFGEKVRGIVVKGERKAQQVANKAYKKAMEMEGDQPTQTQPLVNYLQDNAAILATTNAGKPVIQQLKQLGVISDANMVPLEPTAAFPVGSIGYNAAPITLKELSTIRRTVNEAWKGAKQSGDGVAAAKLNDMRGILNAAEESAGGDLFKAYRVLRSEKGKRFEDNPLIDDLVSSKRGYFDTAKIEDSEVFNKAVLNSTPEQFGKMWVRLTPQARKLTQAQVAKHIEDKVFSNMGMNEAADVVASAAKLRSTLDTLSPKKLNTIFGKDKADKLSTLKTAVQEISNPPSGTRPQGSAPKLEFLTRQILGLMGATVKVPLIGGLMRDVVGGVTEAAASGAASREARMQVERAMLRPPLATAGNKLPQAPALQGIATQQQAN